MCFSSHSLLGGLGEKTLDFFVLWVNWGTVVKLSVMRSACSLRQVVQVLTLHHRLSIGSRVLKLLRLGHMGLLRLGHIGLLRLDHMGLLVSILRVELLRLVVVRVAWLLNGHSV